MTITRAGIAVAVARVAARIASGNAAGDGEAPVSIKRGERALFHMPTGIDQMVWLLAMHRLGIITSSTNIDATASGLAHRCAPESRARARARASFAPSRAHVYALRPALALTSARRARARPVRRLEDLAPVRLVVVGANASRTTFGGRLVDCAAKVAPLLTRGERMIALETTHAWPESLRGGSADVVPGAVTALASDCDKLAQLWKLAPVAPFDEATPLFVSYTSGSTGKPKGIVHVHGGYAYGVALSMRAVFGAHRGVDVMLTLGTTGWITGVSRTCSSGRARG